MRWLKLFTTMLTIFFYFNAHSQIELEDAFPELTFESPVDFQHADDGTNRVFVVEQEGIIRVFDNSDTVTTTRVFLDITDSVAYRGEMGLLGLAFHPDYANNGYFYVNYTMDNPRRTIVSRFNISFDPDSADRASEHRLMSFVQPYSNHNGGQLSFGPDGYLYIATGDGGSAGDPQNNGQNLGTLLGKILRIDINTSSELLSYGIPPDNPFIPNLSARGEIYAYGLRNPWRFSFDTKGTLWCADVGQDLWEEIDTISKGGNYGWRLMEGNACYNPDSNCDTTGLILPVHVYPHDTSGGYSVTGGYVYEGIAVPELVGKYIFADYVSKKVWSLETIDSGVVVEEKLISPDGISSFGVDAENELYALTLAGKIYKFKSTTTDVENNTAPLSGYELHQNYPNPFNPATTIKYSLPEAGFVKIELINSLGQTVSQLEESFRQSGEYSLNVDASGFSSGVYYVRMISQSPSGKSFTKTIKLVYMK